MGHLRLFTWIVLLFLLPAAGFSQSVQLADSLNRQGMEFYESGNYREAEFYLQEAFFLYKKRTTPDIWLSPGIDYAEILVDRSKYEQALPLFKRLKTVAVSQKNIRAQARIENDLGWAYNKTGRNQIALDHLEDAIPLAKEAQDTLRLGYIYNNIGSIYSSRGDYETAISYRKKSLVYKQQTGDLKSISITLNNLGLTYKKLSLYDKALEYYNRSLAIRKKLGNVDLLGSAYNNIASLYDNIGQYDKALIYYQQSLDYLKKTGTPSSLVYALNNIGTLYGVLGQPEQELAYYRQSLQLKEQYANAASLAISYGNIAGSLKENGQKEEALNYYKKALQLRKQAGNPRKEAASLLDLASMEQQQQNIPQALDYIQEAGIIADSTQDVRLQKRTAFQLGNLSQSQRDLKGAADHYHASLRYSQKLEDGASLASLKALAYTYNQLGSDSALSYGRRAIDIIEKTRTQTGPLSRFKAGYFKQHVNFYIAMASWQLKYKRDKTRAYHFAELAKARALSEELSQAAQRIDESLPEKERIKRAQQLSEISALYMSLKKTSNSKDKAAIEAKIRDRELAYSSFENQLLKKYPRYKNLKSPDPISLAAVQQLCDDETAIIEYAGSDDTLLMFLITRNRVKTRQVNLSGKNTADVQPPLAKQVLRFRDAIIAKAPEDSLHALSKPLYTQLIAPFKKELASHPNLLIIPDGVLAYLPFEALYDGNYLVSQYNIKYAPSMTGFSLIPEPRQYASNKVLAIGNAENYTSAEKTLLPTVDWEINSVANMFDDAFILKEQQLTEASVKKQLQQNYSVVHIAAHSVIDEQNSSQSGIILGNGQNETGIGNDGQLRSSEIYRLNISSNMVVLSACKSGIGNLISGEGILGLQRAFFTAGTSTITVSLWDVYDRSTTLFMQHFYSAYIRKETTKSWSDHWGAFLRWTGWDDSMPFGYTASAMREAKLALLNHPRYKHPVYWAPFIVVGR